MTWALIVMVCTRWCTPQYVELYPTRTACTAQINNPKGAFSKDTHYCVPVAEAPK